MYCVKCGKENKDGSKFCVNCGCSLTNGNQGLLSGTVSYENTYSGVNKLFWTKWVRGISKIGMFITIAASIVCGALLCTDDDTVILGVAIMVLGTLISITSVAIVMMISEISINIYELKNGGTIVGQVSYSAGSGADSSNKPSSKKKAPEEDSVKENSKYWICSCGATNLSTNNVCMSCFKSRTNHELF